MHTTWTHGVIFEQWMHDGVDQSVYRNVRNVIGQDGDTEKKREGEQTRPVMTAGEGQIYNQPEPGVWKGHIGHLG